VERSVSVGIVDGLGVTQEAAKWGPLLTPPSSLNSSTVTLECLGGALNGDGAGGLVIKAGGEDRGCQVNGNSIAKATGAAASHLRPVALLSTRAGQEILIAL